jgi:SAM-dependent methyltransferase
VSNTEQSFREKWEKNEQLAFSETLREGSEIFNWILERNGFAGPEEFRVFLSGKRRILDAGCGNGRVTALLRKYSAPETTEIVGIDIVGVEVAERNLAGADNVRFVERNLFDSLGDLGHFDFIYCQEVLHHTGDARKAFLNLSKCLDEGGAIAIYVYKKKGPVREYVDEYVRENICELPYEKAMEVCKQITEFGKALSEHGIKITVPPVDVLAIAAGEYDLQRFIYHFFMKCFWNQNLSFQENCVINYDWYHPQDASKHTVTEVREWFREAGLPIAHEHVDFYGITVRGVK